MFKRLEYSDNIREKAILALGSAFKKKMVHKRDPDNKEVIEEKEQCLERKLKVFYSALEDRKKFCNPDSDTA